MDLTLCCAVPFHYTETNYNNHQTNQMTIREAADIVQILLRDGSCKEKPALPLSNCRRRRPSTGSRRRRKEQRQEVTTANCQPQGWGRLGTSLRIIADNFGSGQKKTGGERLSTTDGILSAIITFVFWKAVKKTFL